MKPSADLQRELAEATQGVRPLIEANPAVLINRKLRPGMSQQAMSRFDDRVWDLTPGIFEEHSTKTTLTFEAFPERWRSPVKAYFWTLINVDVFRPLAAGPAESRPSLRTISFVKPHLVRFLTWCDAIGISDLNQCDSSRLDQLITDLADSDLNYSQRRHIVTEVRRLWTYRDHCAPELALPLASPWLNERPFDLFGRPPQPAGNRTPRIEEATLVPLIAWALRFVEDFADDIVLGFEEYRERILQEYRHRRSDHDEYVPPAARRERLISALENLRGLGLGLPGRMLPNGTREIRWQHLGRLVRSPGANLLKYDYDLIESSNLRIDDDAYLLRPCTGLLDGRPWYKRHLAWDDVIPLVTHLQTACFTIISYFSGMRPGEVLTLERGCLSYDDDREIWMVKGTRWKAATDATGSKAVEGEVRDTPWVVHPAAAAAIQLLHRLHEGRLLFPVTPRPKPIRGLVPPANLRPGRARTSSQMNTDLIRFIDWVNTLCGRDGREDVIPTDPAGPVNGSRFRRTLAWHIVRTPRGLVAGAIQYGHLAKHVTQGYAGMYDSGFPDELAMERWLERIDQVTDLGSYVDSGGHVSGPAATELRHRTRTAAAKFLGRRVPTHRQAAKMISDPSLQVFPGDGMHCVYRSSSALCNRDPDPSAQQPPEGPQLSACRSGCSNLARTDHDVVALQAQVDALNNDFLAPSIRHQRARTISEALQATIESHERSKTQ